MSQTEEEREFVEIALAAADAGNAGHWPTVAGHLADEVRRPRKAIASHHCPSPKPVEQKYECGCDGTPHWGPAGCPSPGLRHA